ncbi:MAG: hypothetical protein HQK61_09260, partial [Desulfamplus sp.]|nr:hypothetical protein [Desulfamplus sp.]
FVRMFIYKESENATDRDIMASLSINRGKPLIAVLKLRHISNFTDLHALSETPEIEVVFVDTPLDLARFRAFIIPGSKNTRSDLEWIHQTGWDKKIREYAVSGGHLLGICGGYQILGQYVDDPEGLEGEPGRTEGLNLLPVLTVLKAPKTTTLSCFSWDGVDGEGYEIHMGQTFLISDSNLDNRENEARSIQITSLETGQGRCSASAAEPMLKVHERNRQPCSDHDGVVSRETNTCGTYMHGFFDSPEIKEKWLERTGIKGIAHTEGVQEKRSTRKNRDYQLLKEHFQKHVDIEKVLLQL